MKITTTDDPNAVEPDTLSRAAERINRRSPHERGPSPSDLAAHLDGEEQAAVDSVERQ
jgi:hypothetical protein